MSGRPSTEQEKADSSYNMSKVCLDLLGRQEALVLQRSSVDGAPEVVSSRVPANPSPGEMSTLHSGPNELPHPAWVYELTENESGIARKIARRIEGYHFGDIDSHVLAIDLRTFLSDGEYQAVFEHKKWSQYTAYRQRARDAHSVRLEYFIESCHASGATPCLHQ